MKKTFLILTVASFLAACGGSSSDKVSGDSTDATHQSAATHQSDAENDTTVGNTGAEKTGGVSSSSKGAQLIANSDCLTCHKEKEKLIGPAYADVAKKYSDKDIDMLANKIIKGGAGNWGDVPMTAHPGLELNDAKEMAKYILTLK
ncbi:c-type cytochrome [Mucilaginibacter lacusdianchii]|uniref:c-type cytochrome n=1 Tax=Mucilaginibacter lacusdianchii TaxID=2684211 RepID=UPI00131CFF20|nr:c-type cytochrome [Mucilaginibacter sp. JXJ CY 39]